MITINIQVANKTIHWSTVVFRKSFIMKVCNRKPCKKTHDTKFKCCPTCRESSRRSRKKRKRKAAEKSVKEGFQLCKKCLHVKPTADFESKVYRRKKMTTWCQQCRNLHKKTEMNPSSSRGQCREFWRNWKKEQSCIDCGLQDFRVIEADHVRGQKVHNLGEYSYWACHGGIQAMQKELEKCEARCKICHTIMTKERSNLKRLREGRKQRPDRERRRNKINAIKLSIGACVECNRKVTPKNCCAFDFDHRDEEKKMIGIANLVYKSQTFYDEHLRSEITKCQLLCANCHKIKTYYKNI